MKNRYLVISLLIGLLSPSLWGYETLKTLAPVYRHWVEAEVPYIISTEERKEFLSLRSDTERDHFMDEFWAVRNPDPHSPINTYKEEHYRRLAYVNRTFGVEKYDEGWRTDMGRMYITLGAPKQRAPYHMTANIREMEIWFYEGATPALPPFFYLLFFKKGSGEEYRLYSPRQDGPQAITSTGQQDTKAALKIIKNALGNEVARTTLSLYPTEPVDLDDPQPSFESDLLLSTIRNLADNPLERERIAMNRSRERVTTSIFADQSAVDVSTAAFRDEQGRVTVNILLRTGAPNPKLVGKLNDKEAGYKMTLRTVVATAAGKPVYDQQEVLTRALQPEQVAAAQQKVFAAEDRLPLVPGSYEIEQTLTNNLNLEAVRWRGKVTVPERRREGMALSELLVYTAPSPVRDQTAELPFSLSRLRFTPRGAQTVTIRQGEKLPLVFQIWLPSAVHGATEAKVHLHYLYGSVQAASKPLGEFDEDVETANADADGNLVTGHTLDTVDLPVGTYRVVVSATRAQVPAAAYATMTLRVVGPEAMVGQWTAYGPVEMKQIAQDDLKRGLAAEALARLPDAEHWFALALQEDPAASKALTHLVNLYSVEHEGGKLAALVEQPLLREPIDLQTVLLVAQALREEGQAKRAVAMLNAQMTVQPPSAGLYRTQAEMLEAAGDTKGAAAMRERADHL